MAHDTPFALIRDINGFNGFGLVFSGIGKKTLLAANVEQHFTVPSGRSTYIAIFEYTSGANINVANNATATVAGASFADCVDDLTPIGRQVSAGDVLSFITSDGNSPQVTVKFYYLVGTGTG